MRKSLLFIFFLFSAAFLTQTIRVKNTEVCSPIASASEDLYISGSQVISVKDSVVHFSSSGFGSFPKTKLQPERNFFISNFSDKKSSFRTYIFNDRIEDRKCLVIDEVPKMVWTVFPKDVKKILGYTCIKATTKFRGRRYIAYFSPELPYSAGPFKFYGLDGLILDVREESGESNIWKAVQIDRASLEYDIGRIDNKAVPRISMRDFIVHRDV